MIEPGTTVAGSPPTAISAPVAAPEFPPLERGTALAPGYVIVGHLSRNKALDVYDVWSTERACRCIAKVVRPDLARRRKAARRLIREGRLLERASHPHIVRAYEVRTRPETMVILETLPGETLARLIERRNRRLATRELAYLGLHVGSAVNYLHRLGILHLDLKPDNIVCCEGKATVLDLSIARPPGFSRSPPGTRRYKAPEQFAPGRLTPATDVWGLGVVLWTAAAAERPFAADTGADAGSLRRAAPIASRRRLSGGLDGLIDACLEPLPEARPGLIEVLEALEGVVETPV